MRFHIAMVFFSVLISVSEGTIVLFADEGVHKWSRNAIEVIHLQRSVPSKLGSTARAALACIFRDIMASHRDSTGC